MKNKNKYLKIFLLTILLMSGLFFIKSDLVISQSGSEIDQEIELLNSQIQNQKKKLENIQKNQQEYSRLIKIKEQEKNTLQNQLEILDNRLKKSELEIEEVSLEISKNNLEVKKINIDIENKNIQIEKNKENISALIRVLYKQNQTSPLEIILLNNSLTDFVNQVTYLENTNKEISDGLAELKKNKEEMDEQKKILEEKEKKLDELKKELENKQNILEGEIGNKEFILTETQESEQEYKKLLQLAKKENDQAMAEISSLEKTVREKLAQKSNSGLEETMNGFIWPVVKNTITATFHDPSYPFRKSIGEHSGIDIRATQGSTLKAAAAGYVARVKFDGSTAYAYIMIIHADGFSTVYGHVSGVNVGADEYVTQGQIIGRTGGAPRTAGAGAFSTGPHLHFEIRKDGLPVNPLNYLP
ncbi:MAG: peptidoglycan DD-metalloendopeptidase family protein [Patescibacteria group bacterium]|nr:peptidoglycan DD-metalloendopeptidase family protein [Patescibacteria group bacterium]